jgi:hypothetical protein
MFSNQYVKYYVAALEEAEMLRHDIASNKDLTKRPPSYKHILCINNINFERIPKIMVKYILNRITKGIRLSKNEKS